MPRHWRFCPIWLVLLILMAGGGTGMAQFTPLKLRPANLRSADTTYRRAIATGDSLLLAEACYLYGKRYAQAGQHLTAKRWFLKSLAIQERRGDSYEHGRLYIRLADLEADQWHQAEALRYAHRAIAIQRRVRHGKGLSTAYCRLARLHLGDRPAPDFSRNISIRPDSAHHYLRLAEPLVAVVNDPLLMAEINELMGKVLLVRHRSKAIEHLRESLRIHQQLSSPGVQIRIGLDLASAHLLLGQPQAARRLLAQANRLYTDQHRNEYDTRLLLETVTAAYYRAIGDWKQAAIHQQNQHDIEKSGLIADREGAISRLSVEYETDRREARLKAQQRELGLQTQNLRLRDGLVAGLFGLLAVATTLSVVYFRLNRKNRQISRRNAELVREQNHRVKNNLQVVSSLLNLYADRLADPLSRMAVEESQLRVETMALLQRRLYDSDRLTSVDLAEFLPDLVEGVLQTYGYADLQTDFRFERAEILIDAALSVGLIVNELTTNACKYAFPRSPKPAFVLSATRSAQTLELTVGDNGPGLPPPVRRAVWKPEREASTFGLRLIQMQVKQLKGTYHLASDHGTRFRLTFPISP